MSPSRRIWLAAFGLALLPAGRVARGQESISADQPTLAQAEHTATDLRRGMSEDTVVKLLGPPHRTGFKSDADAGGKPSPGTLQWSYTWKDGSVQGSLRVDFVSKGNDDWRVSSWEWSNF